MVKPRLFLCETDKTKICELDTITMSGSFKFNTYSELNFSVPRLYTNITTGETQVNPFYDKIEALRLVLVEGFGYFEIQDPEITSDGIKEVKNITANSSEYTLSQKYLENFNINTGEIDSIEVIYATEHDCAVVPVTFYNPLIPGLSLLDLILEKTYGWKIGHVDESLMTIGRTFEISRTSVYDLIMQDICDKFNCFAVFDTIDNTINFYAESLISKFIGDGTTDTFFLSPPYNSINTVTIDGYKTTKYTYVITEDDAGNKKGVLVFDNPPENGIKIEVTDGSQEQWITDVYVSFNNLAQEVTISYSADDIKTVLNVKGADDLDIREVNMGLPYIVDLSYYYAVDWMGQELFDAYTQYIQQYNTKQEEYISNAEAILKIQNDISFAENRTSLGYGVDSSVNTETVGTYYVISGGSYPNYLYKEVSLPADYNANTTYYKINGVNVTEDKILKLYDAVRKYFMATHNEIAPEIKDIATQEGTWEELLEELVEQFEFVPTEFAALRSSLTSDASVDKSSTAFREFLDIIWVEMGRDPLEKLFLKPYETIELANKEAGYADENSEHYWFYYPVTIMLASLNDAIQKRTDEIDALKTNLKAKQDANAEIAKQMSIYDYFTPTQLVRLSSFLREDEYTDDNFVETDIDTTETLMKTKRELLECGRIELSKLCEPKLEFSMNMANIYALPEFEPIIHQFQLGNLINVAIRPDYIKRARLLSVDINFDDFSDFSCEFGELTNLKTPSSIHADLLSSALSAGKTVASNASYWNKGVDLATKTDIKIQQGLLSAINGLYTADQSMVIDDKGILLRKVNEDGSFSPRQTWLRNNTILLSEDGFRGTSTPSLGLGEFVVDGKTFYGILAKAVFSGYIEGSKIVGGTINIGEGTFVVDEFGNVTINAGLIKGYTKNNEIISSINQSPEEVAIDAGRISLAGKNINLTSDNITIESTNFSVTKDGKITATSGDIGGWNITNSYIDSTVSGSSKRLFLASASDSSSRWIGATDSNGTLTFYVTKEGKLYAKNAEIEGKVIASSGTIGGWDINSNSLTKVHNGFGIGFGNRNDDTNLIAVGIPVEIDEDITTMSWDAAPFKVTKDGSIYATKGTIGGWNITESFIDSTTSDSKARFYLASASDGANNWICARNESNILTFYVTKTGKLYAKEADVEGKIVSSSGQIGGWTIGNTQISNSVTNNSDTYFAIMNCPSSFTYAPHNYVAFGVKKNNDYVTYIDYAGGLHSTSATISGNITATSLNISGATITGTISTSNLSSSVITTDNFSSKTLSTSYLTIKEGCVIGSTTYNANIVSKGGYVFLEADSPSGSLQWSIYDIIENAMTSSSRDVKNGIHSFDDRYDIFFDKLNPQLYKYNFIANEGYRMGYIWQDVEEALNEANLTKNDVGAIYESDSLEGGLGLRKEDFIALNTWQIQKLKARVTELEQKLAALEV